MEDAADYSFSIPLLFTALAVILATLLVKLLPRGNKPKPQVVEEEEKVTEMLEKEEKIQEGETGDTQGTGDKDPGKVPVEEVGATEELTPEGDKESETGTVPANRSRTSSESSQDEDGVKENCLESDDILKISEADDADDEDLSFRYQQGKLRGSEFEKMLTKDELEEEQRIELTSDFTSL